MSSYLTRKEAFARWIGVDVAPFVLARGLRHILPQFRQTQLVLEDDASVVDAERRFAGPKAFKPLLLLLCIDLCGNALSRPFTAWLKIFLESLRKSGER